jgi:pyrimidine-nucleoside phosphorylase
MNFVEIIRKKRAGTSLSDQELEHLITGYIDGTIPDYQISAFLMACYFQKMTEPETIAFTRFMLHSGTVIDLSEVKGLKVDKHSTGGVGDKVSIILAPIVAAVGVPVPMISGRSLGHTGGTLDKLESIPGFRTNLSIDEFKSVLKRIGVVMIGQTENIAPADKKLYALRDVTATVECIPLIVSSILSKKLAEGIDALTLDVKTGDGAFMTNYDQAVELAQWLVRVAEGFGKRTNAFVTNMNEPLGNAIGNWLEIVESVTCLRSPNEIYPGTERLLEITYLFGGAMVKLGGRAKTIQEGIDKCREVVADGSAYRKFLELVHEQGGEMSSIENLELYSPSRHVVDVTTTESGYVDRIKARDLGVHAIGLGAGRLDMSDRIDPKAGILLHKHVGDPVEIGDKLATFFTDKENILNEMKTQINRCFQIRKQKPTPEPSVYAYIDNDGVTEYSPSLLLRS